MKKASLFCFLACILLHSCQTNEAKITADGFREFKPGYFCQLEAVAVVGDTIIIAGSYIPEEDPNLTIQPVHSYLAAFGMDGELYWEQKPEVADYISWQQLLPLANGGINVIGIEESPINGYATHIQQVNLKTTRLQHFKRVPEKDLPVINDAALNSTNETVLLKTIRNDTMQCSDVQVIGIEFVRDILPDCRKGQLQQAKFTREFTASLEYLIAYGNETWTTELYFYTTTQLPWQIPLPKEFSQNLVNNIEYQNSKHILLGTTTKNAQGPCLWKSGTDSTWQHTCLEYWPLHGTAQLLQYNDCTLMAFSAADTVKASASYLVMFDKDLKVIWEQEISRTEVFVIKDLAVQHDNIIVAGTIETEGKGSSMAVKVITLPSSKCNTLY